MCVLHAVICERVRIAMRDARCFGVSQSALKNWRKRFYVCNVPNLSQEVGHRCAIEFMPGGERAGFCGGSAHFVSPLLCHLSRRVVV
jgi:hypothetical protein